jgi:predicted ATPase
LLAPETREIYIKNLRVTTRNFALLRVNFWYKFPGKSQNAKLLLISENNFDQKFKTRPVDLIQLLFKNKKQNGYFQWSETEIKTKYLDNFTHENLKIIPMI